MRVKIINADIYLRKYVISTTSIKYRHFCIIGIRGIEISFRELKHTIGMTRFHSKKVDHIKQEIYAKLILYNFCEMITLNVVITQKNDRKYIYKVNFTNATQICIRFYRYFNDIDPLNVEALIKRYITPIRDGRKFPRNLKSQSFVSFFYRVS